MKYPLIGGLVLALNMSVAHAGAFSGWQLNGSAATQGGGDVLALTNASDGYQAGSAWAPGTLSFTQDFSLSFQFTISGGSAADGFALVFQNAAQGASALGATGGGLGYAGIGNSVAVVFDTFDNGYGSDPSGHNTGFAFGGNLDAGFSSTSYASLRDTTFSAWVEYTYTPDDTTGTLRLYVSADGTKPDDAVELTQSNSWAVDFGGATNVRFGFTGATGGATDAHVINALSVTQVPEPQAVALALAGLSVAGVAAVRRRRPQ